jgi:hypothetical protein
MTRDITPLSGAADAPEATRKSSTTNRTAFGQFRANLVHVLRTNLLTGFAALIFVMLLLAALLGPSIAPYDPLATS